MGADEDINVLNASELALLKTAKMIGSWWLLREEESFFSGDVATSRLLMLVQALLTTQWAIKRGEGEGQQREHTTRIHHIYM